MATSYLIIDAPRSEVRRNGYIPNEEPYLTLTKRPYDSLPTVYPSVTTGNQFSGVSDTWLASASSSKYVLIIARSQSSCSLLYT